MKNKTTNPGLRGCKEKRGADAWHAEICIWRTVKDYVNQEETKNAIVHVQSLNMV